MFDLSCHWLAESCHERLLGSFCRLFVSLCSRFACDRFHRLGVFEHFGVGGGEERFGVWFRLEVVVSALLVGLDALSALLHRSQCLVVFLDSG